MKANRLAALVLPMALVAGCAARREAAPAPVQAPAPRPAAVAPAPSPPRDWRDAPITPGSWTYAADASGTTARFGPGAGEALLTLRCDAATRRVTLTRAGAATGALPLTVITTTATRPLEATPVPGDPSRVGVTFSAGDPALDAMAFSRGRFAIEVTGLPALYLPAWPEVGRVVDDCR